MQLWKWLNTSEQSMDGLSVFDDETPVRRTRRRRYPVSRDRDGSIIGMSSSSRRIRALSSV